MCIAMYNEYVGESQQLVKTGREEKHMSFVIVKFFSLFISFIRGYRTEMFKQLDYGQLMSNHETLHEDE